MSSVCVIIPTYNNATTVCDVVRRAYAQLPAVIVVNDGSTDDTLERLAELDTPHDLVTYADNRGKGYALIKGFKHALALGYTHAITLDADGQHYPEDIARLLAVHIDAPDAILVGTRNLRGKPMKRGARFANKLSNFWFATQTAHYLPDTQTGFRLYPLHRLHWLPLVTSRYEAELELLVYASWHDVRTLPVGINVYYPRRERRITHFRPVHDFMRITMLNFVLCLGSGFYGYPRKALKGLRSLICSHIVILLFIIGVIIMTTITPFFMLFARHSAKGRLRYHRILCFLARFIVTVMPSVRYSKQGACLSADKASAEQFDRPSVIICNHQSMLDLLYAMSLTPRLVVTTKRWVWRNPLFGLVIRYAQFIPVSVGYDDVVERARDMVRRGYSVLVYPEGTRSDDCRICRFHQGAFMLAHQLQLDITPIIVSGTGTALPKHGPLYLRAAHVRLKILPRIAPDDPRWGATIKQRTRAIEQHMRHEYRLLLHDN